MIKRGVERFSFLHRFFCYHYFETGKKAGFLVNHSDSRVNHGENGD